MHQIWFRLERLSPTAEFILLPQISKLKFSGPISKKKRGGQGKL